MTNFFTALAHIFNSNMKCIKCFQSSKNLYIMVNTKLPVVQSICISPIRGNNSLGI